MRKAELSFTSAWPNHVKKAQHIGSEITTTCRFADHSTRVGCSISKQLQWLRGLSVVTRSFICFYVFQGLFPGMQCKSSPNHKWQNPALKEHFTRGTTHFKEKRVLSKRYTRESNNFH